MNNLITANIIADSIDKKSNRITSYILNVPQIIVKELLRHRMFSFSSSSMRAIPFNKVLADIRENMFVPIDFQSHHSGMQGSEYLIGEDAESAKKQWVESGLKACEEAEKLYRLGVTKQLCSRIIEPYGYAKILVTATEWENFFKLRCPKYEYYLESYGEEPEIREYFRSRKDMIAKWGDAYVKDLYQTRPRRCVKEFKEEHWRDCNASQAEIHIQALAESMWNSMNESKPNELKAGEWHIPFGDQIEGIKYSFKDTSDCDWTLKYNRVLDGDSLAITVSTARCARLSYMTFDGEIDYEKDIKLHDQLLKDRHMSPFEHCARAMSDDEYNSLFKGKLIVESNSNIFTIEGAYHEPVGSFGWCNNFRGWIQYRYLIENE